MHVPTKSTEQAHLTCELIGGQRARGHLRHEPELGRDRACDVLVDVGNVRHARPSVHGRVAPVDHVALPAAHGANRVACGHCPGGDAAREGLDLRGQVGAELVRVESEDVREFG